MARTTTTLFTLQHAIRSMTAVPPSPLTPELQREYSAIMTSRRAQKELKDRNYTRLKINSMLSL